jgi:excisionase family DNA binding protein
VVSQALSLPLFVVTAPAICRAIASLQSQWISALQPVHRGIQSFRGKNKVQKYLRLAGPSVLGFMTLSRFEELEAQSGPLQTVVNSHHYSPAVVVDTHLNTGKPKAILSVTPGATSRDPLISVDQAARQLLMHPKTLVRKAREGQIPGRKVANKWRFRALELDAWVDRQTVLQSKNRQPN